MSTPAEQIQAALETHPAVRACLVLEQPAPDGGTRLLAYVTPYPDYPARLAATPPHDPGQQVRHWQEWYDGLYWEARARDPQFNTAGWMDTATGQPLPAAAMREWVTQTLARVRAGRPRRVLEIGCGTGLLLWRLAPACREYWGTDVAPFVVQQLRLALAVRPALGHVTILERAADDFADLPTGHFDLVILNSVVQYFPDLAYLLRVLTGIAPLLAPGGRVFLGDVRSLPLLPLYHAGIVLAQAADTSPREELQERIAARVAGEQELLLDPALFPALPAAVPWIRHVDTQLKRGRWPTEMARFRYDVLLHTTPARPPIPDSAQRTWDTMGRAVEGVAAVLRAEQPAALAVAAVPNARLGDALALQHLLADPGGPQTAGGLREALASLGASDGIDPEAFWALGRHLPYRVAVRPAASGRLDRYDVVFTRRTRKPGRLADAAPAPPGEADVDPPRWAAYANVPRTGGEPRALVQDLRRFLAEQLPAVEQPALFVVLEAFRRTADGTIDRAALPL